jgi:hypothetical protein
VALDCAITFAPSGNVVVDALSSLRKGGVVAINAIHLNQMPAFDYDKLLWGERQIRSVANMTRDDARDFLALAHKLNIQPRVSVFSLDQANQVPGSPDPVKIQKREWIGRDCALSAMRARRCWKRRPDLSRCVWCFPALHCCAEIATAYVVEEPCAPLQHTLSGV